MHHLFKTVPLFPIALLAACGGSDPVTRAPFAATYKATQASATQSQVNQALDTPGESLQGLTAVVEETFGTTNAVSKKELLDPSAFEISRTANGYKITGQGKSYSFTDAQIANGEYTVKEKNAAGIDRTIAFLFSGRTGDLPKELRSDATSMVPLFFGIRTNSKGPVTADNATGFVLGSTIVGLETPPSAVPSTGKAQYKGNQRTEFFKRSIDFGSAAPDQQISFRYRGDATIDADFGSGTVSGVAKLNDVRESFTKSPNVSTVIAGKGAEFVFSGARIVQNGFEAPITGNAAAIAELQSKGVSTSDLETKGVGRFYGTAAQEVGVVAAGQSASHSVSGVIVGKK